MQIYSEPNTFVSKAWLKHLELPKSNKSWSLFTSFALLDISEVWLWFITNQSSGLESDESVVNLCFDARTFPIVSLSISDFKLTMTKSEIAKQKSINFESKSALIF